MQHYTIVQAKIDQTSTHIIRNTSPSGLRPSVLLYGYGSSQYVIVMVERGRSTLFLWPEYESGRLNQHPLHFWTLFLLYILIMYKDIPANTKHLYNIYTTSAQRLRRWSNIDAVIKMFCVIWDVDLLMLTFIWRPTPLPTSLDARHWSNRGLMYATLD